MTRQQLKEKIINKLNPFQLDNWGYAANYLQEVAENALTAKEFRAYLMSSSKDMEECDGSDFIVFNGQYFDWKEFSYRSPEIINAFLDYFSDNQLERMLARC